MEALTLLFTSRSRRQFLTGKRSGAMVELKMVDAVVRSAPVLARQSSAAERFKFGKKNTWWLPLFDEHGRRPQPRSAVEVAAY